MAPIVACLVTVGVIIKRGHELSITSGIKKVMCTRDLHKILDGLQTYLLY